MQNVIKILEKISQTSSTKEKTAILIENKDNKLLIKLLFYCYNPFKMYGISESKLNEMEFKTEKQPCDIWDIWSMLEELANNNINDSLRQQFCDTMSLYSQEEQELIKRVVIKDLRIGINVSTINKVWKGLIPVFGVQLANKYEPTKLKEHEFIYITEKLDGVRCVVIKDNNTISFFSRQGKPIIGLEHIAKSLSKVEGSFMFDGELLLKTSVNVDSGDLYRQTVKVVNSKQDDKTNVEYHVFDIITLQDFQNGVSKTTYGIRRIILDSLHEKFKQDKDVHIVQCLYSGTDHSMIMKTLKHMEEKGKEGVMINKDEHYYCKRCNSLLKVKSMQTCDLQIIGFENGSGKNENTLGALIVDYKGYPLGVGSGFSEQERDYIWVNKDSLLGRVIEVQYFEESVNQNGGLSLRFPVFKCIREEGKEVSYN